LAKTYIEDSRYADPDVVLIHPRLFNDWVGTLFDNQSRPLFAPGGNAFSPAGVVTNYDAAAGEVAQLLGLRVVTDVNLSNTAVYVLRIQDFHPLGLWAEGAGGPVQPVGQFGVAGDDGRAHRDDLPLPVGCRVDHRLHAGIWLRKLIDHPRSGADSPPRLPRSSAAAHG
jgi:hypothetical protein